MPQSRNIFVGGADFETAPENVPANKFTYARNIQLGRGAVETAWGNKLLATPDFALDTDARAVGIATDTATGLHYVLLHSDAAPCIARLDPASGSYTLLLRWAGLRLPATPTRNVAFLDGLLLWLDEAGQLRELNVETAADYTPALLDADPLALHVVKAPPLSAPTGQRAEAPATEAARRAGVNKVAGAAWQFALQYEYADGYRTPLGPYSPVVPMRTQTSKPALGIDPQNVITLSLGLAGAFAPSPLVQKVRVLARQDARPAWQLATELARTAGGWPAQASFYGDTTGEVVAASDATKPYEALPVEIGCLTLARSRIFVGDCVDDYAPPKPAFSARATTGLAGAGAADTTIYQVDYTYTVEVTEYYSDYGDEYEITHTEDRQGREFYARQSGDYPDPASTYKVMDFDAGSYGERAGASPLTYAQAFEFGSGPATETPGTRTVTVLTGQPVLAGPLPSAGGETLTLHEGSTYRAGVQFYDALGRHAGALSVVDVPVPAQDYAAPVAQNLTWNLPTPEAGQTAEIPEWATSYALVVSPNRTASYFLQFVAKDIKQYRGDNPTTTEANLEDLLANGTFFVKQVWVPTTALLEGGRGYSFTAGDRIRFPQLASQDYPILSVRGDYLAIHAEAVEPLREFVKTHPAGPVAEIYRPAVAAENQPLYERGARYPIYRTVDANGQPQRRYSVTSGILEGDTYLLRPLNLEAMNPTFAKYGDWLGMDRGRPTAVAADGPPARRKALVRHSGVKVAGTRLHGLSVWDAESQHDCPQEQGAITALLLAAQTQAEGSVLLAVQEAGTQTLYLGQAPLQLAAGGQLNAVSDRVIGGGNDLRGGFGTRHPASVTGWQGKAWWWDAANAELVRYAQNGATPLASKYQATSRCRQLARDYADATIHGAYDPANEQFLLFFGAVGDNPAQTLVWSERYEAFADAWDLPAELGTQALDTLLSFQGGQPWLHHPDYPRLSFFGSPVTAVIETCINEQSEYSKTWKNYAQVGPRPWRVAVRNELGQASRILPPWLVAEQGIYRAAFRRDEKAKVPKGQAALVSGPELTSPTLTLTLTYLGADPARLVSVDTGFVLTPGQEPPR